MLKLITVTLVSEASRLNTGLWRVFGTALLWLSAVWTELRVFVCGGCSDLLLYAKLLHPRWCESLQALTSPCADTAPWSILEQKCTDVASDKRCVLVLCTKREGLL